MKMTSEIMEKAVKLKEYMTTIRRHLHTHPELGFQEHETTSLIKRELESTGVEVIPLKANTGVLGLLAGEKDGPDTVTALRADIDALPIVEQTGLPYASQIDGIMHACGHDGHTAGLLGAAKLLSSMKEKFSGKVKFIFQPAEEIFGGAKSMVDEGVLENPKVDTIVALHGFPGLEVGKIGVIAGTCMASADRFEATVIGSGGHGAYPHRTADAVFTTAQTVVALQGIVSREIDSLDNVVLSVCTLNGGKAFNIIPETVNFSGTVRCLNEKIRDKVEEKVDRVIKGVTSTFGCRYELNYVREVPVLINDAETIALITEAADSGLGQGHVVQFDAPVMGSEDFPEFINNVAQGAYFRLGLAGPGAPPMRQHNDRFDFNDEALPIGAAVLTQFVLMKNQLTFRTPNSPGVPI